MFAKSSRYNGIKIVETSSSHGRKVSAIFIRRVLKIDGDPMKIVGNDRLDIIASNTYKDPTRFWHIADANNELQANDLVKKSSKLKTISVPKL